MKPTEPERPFVKVSYKDAFERYPRTKEADWEVKRGGKWVRWDGKTVNAGEEFRILEPEWVYVSWLNAAKAFEKYPDHIWQHLLSFPGVDNDPEWGNTDMHTVVRHRKYRRRPRT